MSLEVVRVKNLTFQYNQAEVLKGVDLTIDEGDYIGLVGPNGSGKTTLLKNILHLIPPASGEVLLFGVAARRFRNWEKIGFLPQKGDVSHPAFPATVREVVEMGLALKPLKTRRELVDRALARLQIRELGNRMMGELSGGQRQRALLARSIVNDPRLLILDEPVTALDPESREHFFALLEEMNRREGVTIILVTHDIGTVGSYASKLLYLDRTPLFYGTFDSFCRSEAMTGHFGSFSQHIICHQHNKNR